MLRLVQPGDREAIAAIRELFVEYAAGLGFNLCFQSFEEELRNLPGRYAAPTGALLLATSPGQVLGCVGVRDHESTIGELKRLYVRPAARGTGLGRQLALAAIDRARDLGYERLRLDTLPTMGSAIRIYESLGFRDIPPYTFNPIPGARYMELKL